MAETDRIALMAEKVSNDVFGVFGWSKIGPINNNWPCSTPAHNKLTHPSDVAFWYDDPYSRDRVFWCVDLKSYAAGTITKAHVAGAVSSLAKSVACANSGTGWQDLFWDKNSEHWRCDGLLFVYNHDNAYSKDFSELIAQIDNENFKLPAKRRIAIIGPERVLGLANIVADIRALKQANSISSENDAFQFWYPDLVGPRKGPQERSAATIEMLLGPWVTGLGLPESHEGRKKFYVWYWEQGNTVDEFKYLIDSFFRFQMLDDKTHVNVRFLVPNDAAITNFDAAKRQIGATYLGLADERLTRITCEPITNFCTQFSPVALGMER